MAPMLRLSGISFRKMNENILFTGEIMGYIPPYRIGAVRMSCSNQALWDLVDRKIKMKERLLKNLTEFIESLRKSLRK